MLTNLQEQVVTPEMREIQSMIIQTIQVRNRLKDEMQHWYDENPSKHFPKMSELIMSDSTLSKLDSHYKQLWDFHNAHAG